MVAYQAHDLKDRFDSGPATSYMVFDGRMCLAVYGCGHMRLAGPNVTVLGPSLEMSIYPSSGLLNLCDRCLTHA